MRVTGNATLVAEPGRVFAMITDPAAVAGSIPGCEALDQIDADRCRLSVTGRLASVSGTYEGEVRVTQRRQAQLLVLHGQLVGAPGSVDATLRLTMAEGERGCVLGYDVDLTAGGKLAGVGQRLLQGAVRRAFDQWLAQLDAALAVPEPLPGDEPATVAPTVVTGAVRGTVYRTPNYEPYRRDAAALLVAAAVGAAIALVGVGIGWRLRRLATR